MNVRLTTAGLLGGCVALMSLFWAITGSDAAAPNDKAEQRGDHKVSGFMRAKLANAQSVLDGLVTEDFNKIKTGAQKMVVMSKAAEWAVIEGPVYAQYSSEFRRAAQNLIRSAEEKNIDAAALAYVNLTLNCVNCHSFIRSSKVAAAQPAFGAMELAQQLRPHE